MFSSASWSIYSLWFPQHTAPDEIWRNKTGVHEQVCLPLHCLREHPVTSTNTSQLLRKFFSWGVCVCVSVCVRVQCTYGQTCASVYTPVQTQNPGEGIRSPPLSFSLISLWQGLSLSLEFAFSSWRGIWTQLLLMVIQQVLLTSRPAF